MTATCLNPYGVHVYDYVGSITSAAAPRHIEEWLPPTLATATGAIFWLSLPALACLFAMARRRPTVREVCLFVCFLPLACRSVRMVAWWLLAIAPILASLLSTTLLKRADERDVPRPSWVAASLAGLLAILAIVSVPALEGISPLFRGIRSSHRIESNLAAAVRSSVPPATRTFARLEWGEYLDWSLGPTHRVFMDGRIEAYDDALWHEYCIVTSADERWQDVLSEHHINCLLLDATYHGRLLSAVRASRLWEEAGASGPAIVFLRRSDNEIADNVSPNP